MLSSNEEASIDGCRAFFEEANRLLTQEKENPLDQEGVTAFFRRANELLTQEEEKAIDEEEIREFFEKAEELFGNDVIDKADIEEFFSYAREHVMGEAERMLSEMMEKVSSSDDVSGVNFLEVFGIALKESPHSRLVAWLLEPDNPHGLGDSFLVSFLEEAKRIHDYDGDLDLSGVRILQEKAGESGYPDIVIEGKDFTCVIENKIRSAEGLDQTTRYANDCDKEAEERGIDKKFLVFLTPQGKKPKDGRFKPLSYPTLIFLLKECMGGTTEEARFIIDQFIRNLRKNVLKEFRQEERAQEIMNRCEDNKEYALSHFLEIAEVYEEVCHG